MRIADHVLRLSQVSAREGALVRNMRGTCLDAAIALALANPLAVTGAVAQSAAQGFRVEAGSLLCIRDLQIASDHT